MRPIIMYVFVMMLSVAVFAKAELRPAGAERPQAPGKSGNLTSKYYDLTFQDFKKRYSKQYTSVAEQDYRRLIFQKNLANLNQHNSNPQRTYNMKPNAFLDVSKDEFKQVYSTTRPPDQHSRNITEEMHRHTHCQQGQCQHKTTTDHSQQNDKSALGGDNSQQQREDSSKSGENITKNQIEIENGTRLLQSIVINPGSLGKLSSSKSQILSTTNKTESILSGVGSKSQIEQVYIDWSAYSGNIRFQGFCGACYAFATVDTLSAHLAIYSYGFYYELSVQQIIDCTNNGLTYGCRGGYLQGSLTQIQMNGIVSQTAYPFSSGNSGFEGKCKYKSGSFKVKTFTTLEVGSCPTVLKELKKGPVSAGISGYNLRFYDSGVFNDCSARDQLDHAIMIVGYSSGQGWRIKNSWGVDWGEDGFGWIAEGNTCGICNMTVSITV